VPKDHSVWPGHGGAKSAPSGRGKLNVRSHSESQSKVGMGRASQSSPRKKNESTLYIVIQPTYYQHVVLKHAMLIPNGIDPRPRVLRRRSARCMSVLSLILSKREFS